MSKNLVGCILVGIVFLAFSPLARAQDQFDRSFLVGSSSHVVQDSAKKKSRVRSPKGAFWRALLFPGWGQWYNGKKVKAVLVFTAEAGLIANGIYWNQKVQSATNKYDRAFYENNRNLSNWWLLFTIFMGVSDAYVDAQLSDFDVSPNLSFSGSLAFPIGISLKAHLK